MVYNYYDSCNICDSDTSDFIDEMNRLIHKQDYKRDDSIVYTELLNKIDSLNNELELYKSDEKLFMYHVEKVSYNLLKKLASKHDRGSFTVSYKIDVLIKI